VKPQKNGNKKGKTTNLLNEKPEMSKRGGQHSNGGASNEGWGGGQGGESKV